MRRIREKYGQINMKGAVASLVLALAIALSLPQPMEAIAAAPDEGPSASDRALKSVDAEAKALAQAVDTGEPVEVLPQRTEISQVFANPSGTFTQDSYATPQWTRKNHKLVDINTDLASEANGRIAAKATEIGVSFSGGGSGPLVTVARDGRSLSFGWLKELPKPAISEDTATYPEVLPGVDLKLKANNSGFSQLLVVKSAEAAANPELRSIGLSFSADGLNVTTDGDGNLAATDPAGQKVFVAPAPRMWDSSTATTPAAARSVTPSDGGPVPNGEFEPGHGARESVIPIRVADKQMTLSPDQSLLMGEGTKYPVYIDPAVTGAREAWTIAYKKTPTTGYFNGAGWDGATTPTARVGYENMTNGLARSMFRMDTNNLWNTKKQVIKSTFRAKNSWSWSCTKKKVEVWLTGSISASTNWNSQNSTSFWKRKLDDVTDAKGYSSSCPGGNLAFDVTSGVTEAASKKWPNITLGLQATDEADVYSWKKFDAKSAVLSTEYNTVPNAPTSLNTSPSSGGCLTSAPFISIGNTDVTLNAKVSDPDGGTVNARFDLWATGHHPNDDPNGVLIVSTKVSTTSGKIAALKVPKATLQKYLTTANGNFSWKARAEDSASQSSWTPAAGQPGCRFVFDPTRPSTPPTIKSTDFPDGSDGWPQQTGEARKPGSFIIGNGGVNDVTSYEYWTDWDTTVRTTTPTEDLDGDGKKDGGITLTPPSAGSQRVHVRSLDTAKNRSDSAQYLFYANSPAIPDKAGDLNGDGNADLYGVRTDGELWLYPGQGNGRVGTATVAGNTDFNGAGITHRGDWTGDGYEDLVAAIPGDGGKTLHVFPNNGLGFACTSRDEQADGQSQFCQFDAQELQVADETNNHFAAADQFLAVGDVDGPLDTDGDGTIDVPGYPDLLVKEGNRIWLYFGAESFYLDQSRAPVLIGDGSWSDYDLVAPGDRTGNGRVDLISRHKTSGELRLYEGTGDSGEGLGSAPASITIGSGWTRTNRPLTTAVPDADGDAKTDIWATGGDARLYFYPNISGSGVAVGTSGWQNFQALS
ncbi:FG-GAP repeat domain-containing protein [Streptomyces sp. NPDC014685]|uniref:FG-GAP repeat domain-containing protein n=1 Tax=Streptomyces sp. NPDC014685 TaxID=3364881 RepID=UPI0036F7592F